MMQSWLKEEFESLPSNYFRKLAWNRFETLGFPSKKEETFHYVNLDHFDTAIYRRPKQTEQAPVNCCENAIYVMNGKFRPDLSKMDPQIVALPFSQAVRIYEAYFKSKWDRLVQEEKNAFVALNAACFDEGVFLYIPPGYQSRAAIEITHWVQAEEGSLIIPRVDLFCGKESKVDIIYRVYVEGAHWINGVCDFVLDEGASANMTALFDGCGSGYHFEAVRAHLKTRASFNHLGFSNGNKIIRQDFAITLGGEHAHTSLTGASRCTGRRENHVNTCIEHRYPHTTSSQLFKGILDDRSRSSFEGKIKVLPIAQKTQAYQVNRNLILNRLAAAFSKPNLEILADDVKASHGSTMGPLDDELLFYLKSRGIGSSHLLIRGFLEEVFKQVESPSILSAIQRLVQI